MGNFPKHDGLCQRSASFFCPRPDSQYFRLCGPAGKTRAVVPLLTEKMKPLQTDETLFPLVGFPQMGSGLDMARRLSYSDASAMSSHEECFFLCFSTEGKTCFLETLQRVKYKRGTQMEISFHRSPSSSFTCRTGLLSLGPVNTWTGSFFVAGPSRVL